MERTMHMDDKKKKTLGILSFIPLFTFLIFAGYLLAITYPYIPQGGIFTNNHDAISSAMAQHYGTLLVLSGIAFITGVAMLTYYVIHIARLTNMSAGAKIAWMMFMVVFMGVAFPIFWYQEIRNEPEDLPVHPDYA